jgi:hypothetical protein
LSLDLVSPVLSIEELVGERLVAEIPKIGEGGEDGMTSSTASPGGLEYGLSSPRDEDVFTELSSPFWSFLLDLFDDVGD